MDWHKLQHKLFEMDPSDPREDLAKLAAHAQGNNSVPEDNVDYLQESVEVPEGSLHMDRDYSVNDFAALAGVNLNEGVVDAFKAGYRNYKSIDAVKQGVAAMGSGDSPKDSTSSSKSSSSTPKAQSIDQLSQGDSFKDDKGMVWYYNPRKKNWMSKDRKLTISPEEGFKRWMKSQSPRKRFAKEDQIEELESRVAYLESMLESLLEDKQKTGSAGQAKGKDPMPKAEPGRTKHPLKDKLVGEADEPKNKTARAKLDLNLRDRGHKVEKSKKGKGSYDRSPKHKGKQYESIKEELWARLNEFGKS